MTAQKGLPHVPPAERRDGLAHDRTPSNRGGPLLISENRPIIAGNRRSAFETRRPQPRNPASRSKTESAETEPDRAQPAAPSAQDLDAEPSAADAGEPSGAEADPVEPKPAPTPEPDAAKAPEGPKRGGWWQRALGR